MQPDFKEEGRLAAEILERLMSKRDGRNAEARLHLVGVKAIVQPRHDIGQCEKAWKAERAARLIAVHQQTHNAGRISWQES